MNGENTEKKYTKLKFTNEFGVYTLKMELARSV